MRITAFSIPKPKRFSYEPRFYDPKKELQEERERRVLRELENEAGDSVKAYKPMNKGDVKHYITFARPGKQKSSKGGILLRLITVILALTVALLVFYGTWVLVKLV